VPLAFSLQCQGWLPLLTTRAGLHPNARCGALPKGGVAKGRVRRPPQPEAAPLALRGGPQMPSATCCRPSNVQSSPPRLRQAVRDLGRIWPGQARRRGAGRRVLIDRRLDAFVAATPGRRWGGRPRRRAQRRRDCPHHARWVLPSLEGTDRGNFPAGVGQGWCLPTETLAADINMPARTTVISALSKRTERGHRPLMGSGVPADGGPGRAACLGRAGAMSVTVRSRFRRGA